ncbi:transposase [Streptomyces mirabilis]|uniref:transposase n=1 Tax=Streptomyces mirabilis TaxID=68239 RepID=UPI002250188C|nr:transposase [Streptomyces mirabilis]MCX4428675.1 transposase [Streptomyces mirabilis]
MPPDPTVPASLLAVLGALRGSFTSPTFPTFAALVTGLIANTGRGTVTGMLLGAGLTRCWSHDRAHSFFARARWEPQTLGGSLSHLVVRSLVPDGTPLTVAVDDTLFKRRGKKVFGAAWQHDGSAAGRDGIGYGTCFVVLGLIVDLPFLPRPVCLPVAARLHRPKGEQTKVELAASLTSPPAEAGGFFPRGLSFLLLRQQLPRTNGKGRWYAQQSYASSTDLTSRQPGGRPGQLGYRWPDGLQTTSLLRVVGGGRRSALAANRLSLPCSAGVRFLPRLKDSVGKRTNRLPHGSRRFANMQVE